MTVPWVKSSHSPTGTLCVEVQIDRAAGIVRVRNSKKPGVVAEFTTDEWIAFTGGVQDGEMLV